MSSHQVQRVRQRDTDAHEDDDGDGDGDGHTNMHESVVRVITHKLEEKTKSL